MKTTKFLLIFALVAALSASLFLAGCGSDSKDAPSADTAVQSTAAGTDSASSGTTSDSGSAAPQTEDAPDVPYVNPLEGKETVSEEFAVGENLSLRQYKLLKSMLFEDKGGKSYNWYEFYNACIRGEIKLTDTDAVTYAGDSFEFFEEFGMENEMAQAQTVVDAAKGLAG